MGLWQWTYRRVSTLLGGVMASRIPPHPSVEACPLAASADAGIIDGMNVDSILREFNEHHVSYILIGGMNFLLRHAPVLTFDIDVWIDDTPKNRDRCENTLAALHAEWGATDDDWRPVAARPPGWLGRQILFCLTSPHGSIDVFRAVKGLESWETCRQRAYSESTAAGTSYPGLSDEDMLTCQIALDSSEQKPQRIQVLKQALSQQRLDRGR